MFRPVRLVMSCLRRNKQRRYCDRRCCTGLVERRETRVPDHHHHHHDHDDPHDQDSLSIRCVAVFAVHVAVAVVVLRHHHPRSNDNLEKTIRHLQPIHQL